MFLIGLFSVFSLVVAQDVTTAVNQPITHYIRQFNIPYTITRPGSYALAENILGRSGDTINIVLDSVGAQLIYLDLNGYKVTGSGGTNGIRVQSSPQLPSLASVKISNGSLNNFLDHGICINANAHSVIIDTVHCISCGGADSNVADAAGFSIAGNIINATLSNCLASCNRYGFYLQSMGIILSDCLAKANELAGFLSVGSNSVMRSCVASENSPGFEIQESHCSLYHCNAIHNVTHGIEVAGQTTHIIECEMMANNQNGCSNAGAGTIIADCVISGNENMGILCIAPATIKRNIIGANGKQGIVLQASGCSVNDNDISSNGDDGISIARNVGDQQIINNKITHNAGTGIDDLTVQSNCIYGNFSSSNGTNYHNVSFVTSPTFSFALNHTANISQ
jgi:parallel beta-helix repeat protein